MLLVLLTSDQRDEGCLNFVRTSTTVSLWLKLRMHIQRTFPTSLAHALAAAREAISRWLVRIGASRGFSFALSRRLTVRRGAITEPSFSAAVLPCSRRGRIRRPVLHGLRGQLNCIKVRSLRGVALRVGKRRGVAQRLSFASLTTRLRGLSNCMVICPSRPSRASMSASSAKHCKSCQSEEAASCSEPLYRNWLHGPKHTRKRRSYPTRL